MQNKTDDYVISIDNLHNHLKHKLKIEEIIMLK